VTEGVLVRSVTKGSAAEKAGIKAGDVITRVGDSKVSTPADVSSRLRAVRGKPVPVTLMRDRKEVTVNVSLEDRDQAGNPFGIDGGFWRQTQPVTGPGPGPGPGLGPGLGPAPLIHFEPDARFRSGATSGSVQ